MKYLKPLGEAINGEFDKLNCVDYDDPLLEYVVAVSEKYMPYTRHDWENGHPFSKGIYHYASRYFQDKIEKKELRQKFLKDVNIKNTIIEMGYNICKFWYLALFIYDYSYGFCEEGIKSKEKPEEIIKEFIDRIERNIEACNPNSSLEITPKKSMEISLNTMDGKHAMHIKDFNSIVIIAAMCHEGLKNSKYKSWVTQSNTRFEIEDNQIIYNPQSKSLQMWYFTELFLTFFKLIPPKRKRARESSKISLNKKLLISRLIYLFGLNSSKEFNYSDDHLKGYIKRHKGFNMEDMINLNYM